MRTLEQALLDHEHIVLRVIGEWLGLDLTGRDKPRAVAELAGELAQFDLVREVEFLEPEEAAALTGLVRQGGRAPVGVFEGEHGEVRQMGPGGTEVLVLGDPEEDGEAVLLTPGQDVPLAGRMF